MDPRQSVFIATSLDGFIARPDGDLDWLSPENPGEGIQDFGFEAFMDSVDALVMGRGTFDKVLSFDGWYYGTKRVVVLSGNPVDIPDRLPDTVTSLAGSRSPQEIVELLAKEDLYHLYVDGGITIQRFLRAGFIQEMTISQIPVLIGEGIPLFGPLEKDIRLELLESKSYSGGMVQSHYKVIHPK